MRSRLYRSISHAALAVCLTLTAGKSVAQATAGAADHPDSRIDIYAGYGFFHPINSGIDNKQYQDLYNPNATASITGYFNHFFGVQIEGGYFSGQIEHQPYVPTCSGETCSQLIYTAQAGPVIRYPLGSWVPFIHALGGGARVNGPAAQNLKWGWGVTGGFGVDYVLPWFNHHIAVRPIQADFQYSQVVYGPLVLPAGTTGGFGEIDALKLSGGLVFRIGEKTDIEPVVMACSAEPTVVHPGDMITVTGSVTGLNPRLKTFYTWASSGGKLVPSGPTATLDTTGLAPGDYGVNGHVQQGMKPRQQSSCTAPFTVKPFDPPTISCATSASTAMSGDTINITATANSPQNRPLTYSYSANAGQVSGTGPAATLSTAGLDAQTVSVNCNVTDDLGHNASATTQVTITKPPVPVVTETQPLCSLTFDRDKKRPVRVDNELKACLDDIALALNQQADAKLVVVGNASPDENPEAAAERTLNERQYLTVEKGIDQSRIEVRVGDTSGRTVNNTLVPAGAIFNDANTELFDENAITRTGQAYGVPKSATAAPAATPRHHRRRPAGAAAPTASTDGTAPAPPQGDGSTLSQLPR